MHSPKSWRKPLYSRVSKWIGINVDEFEYAFLSVVICRGNFEDYSTPNAFFTRDLKKDVRPIIRCKNLILSPVDGTVSIYEENLPTSNAMQLHQVKGVRYDLNEFVGEHVHISDSNNLYSVVLYLSPANYHRIHAPSNFTVENRVHVPGQLLPVKPFYANKVKGLFTLNERVVLNGAWQEGFFSMGLVGAFNVGSILLENAKDPVVTNRPNELLYRNYRHRMQYGEPWEVTQGEKVAVFEMGSTVVLAFEAPQFTWLVQPGEKVKVGQPLGYVEYDEEVERVTEVDYPEAVRRSLLQGDVSDGNDDVVIEEMGEEEVNTEVGVEEDVKNEEDVKIEEMSEEEVKAGEVGNEMASEAVEQVNEVVNVVEVVNTVNEVMNEVAEEEKEDAWILHPTSWRGKNEDMW